MRPFDWSPPTLSTTFRWASANTSSRTLNQPNHPSRQPVEYKRTFTPAYSLLAKISKGENDFEQAIYNYEQAAKYETSKGKKVQFLLLLVNLLIKEERIEEAGRHIEEAKRLDPTNPNILFYSGELASRDERWEEARDNYEKALLSDRLKNANPSEKAKYYYFLGVALSNLGDASRCQASVE